MCGQTGWFVLVQPLIIIAAADLARNPNQTSPLLTPARTPLPAQITHHHRYRPVVGRHCCGDGHPVPEGRRFPCRFSDKDRSNSALGF